MMMNRPETFARLACVRAELASTQTAMTQEVVAIQDQRPLNGDLGEMLNKYRRLRNERAGLIASLRVDDG
jgi:hypothetical protein